MWHSPAYRSSKLCGYWRKRGDERDKKKWRRVEAVGKGTDPLDFRTWIRLWDDALIFVYLRARLLSCLTADASTVRMSWRWLGHSAQQAVGWSSRRCPAESLISLQLFKYRQLHAHIRRAQTLLIRLAVADRANERRSGVCELGTFCAWFADTRSPCCKASWCPKRECAKCRNILKIHNKLASVKSLYIVLSLLCLLRFFAVINTFATCQLHCALLCTARVAERNQYNLWFVLPLVMLSNFYSPLNGRSTYINTKTI